MIDTCEDLNKLNYCTKTFSKPFGPKTVDCETIKLNFKKPGLGQKPVAETQIEFTGTFTNIHSSVKENERLLGLFKSFGEANRILIDVQMFF